MSKPEASAATENGPYSGRGEICPKVQLLTFQECFPILRYNIFILEEGMCSLLKILFPYLYCFGT